MGGGAASPFWKEAENEHTEGLPWMGKIQKHVIFRM
jgi:hypothetical protein